MKKVLFLLMLFCAQSIFSQRVFNSVDTNKPTPLTQADTIDFLRQKGDTCMIQLNYNLAAFYYRKMLEKKISDSYALRRLKEAEHAQKRICKSYFTYGEQLFYRKDYLNSKPFYEKVVEQGCNFTPIARERLLQIEKTVNSKKKDVDK